MQKEKDIIFEGLKDLLFNDRARIFVPSSKYDETYECLLIGSLCNSGNTLAGACGNVSALMRDYYRAWFKHHNIDGDCLRVSSFEGATHFHCYNLVRVEKHVLLLDGTGGQFLRPPGSHFPPLGIFIGERRELKEIADRAIENTFNFLRGTSPELANRNDAWLEGVMCNPETAFPYYQSLDQSGCAFALTPTYEKLWLKAWGESSIPVSRTDAPADLTLWRNELKPPLSSHGQSLAVVRQYRDLMRAPGSAGPR
jgi:hypothetical protein